MPPKKNKKNALTFYIETTLIPDLQREGHQFRGGRGDGIAGLIPEASRRYKVNNLFTRCAEKLHHHNLKLIISKNK